MSAARFLGALLPVLLLLFLAGAGVWWAIRRDPSSSRPELAGDLAWWAALPTESQAEMDDLVLGPGARLRQTPEEAVRAFVDPAALEALDAEDSAREAARHLAHRAQVNALYHP